MTLMSQTREVSVRRKGWWPAAAGSAAAAALLLSGLGTSVAQAAPPEKDSVYYASPDGRDEGQCQEQHPCSLEHVQGVVRHEAAKGKGDVTVVLADGTYRIDSPLEFRAEDSGRDGHTVRWTAAEGAHPEISGSTQLSGWEKHDEAANIYVADTPVGFETRQLYVDGVAAPRAATKLALTGPDAHRHGDDDQQSGARPTWRTCRTRTGSSSSRSATSPTATPRCRASWAARSRWPSPRGTTTRGAGTRCRTRCSPSRRGSWRTRSASWTRSGEWYVDPDAGKLYYKPADGVNPTGPRHRAARGWRPSSASAAPMTPPSPTWSSGASQLHRDLLARPLLGRGVRQPAERGLPEGRVRLPPRRRLGQLQPRLRAVRADAQHLVPGCLPPCRCPPPTTSPSRGNTFTQPRVLWRSASATTTTRCSPAIGLGASDIAVTGNRVHPGRWPRPCSSAGSGRTRTTPATPG